jgi:hypothetical protein
MYLQKTAVQPDVGTQLIQRVQWKRGMGCAPCGGKCGLGCCAGLCSGLGIFDSMDFTTWSWPEWAVLGVAAFALFSMVSTTKRATRTIKRKLRRRRAPVA